MIYEGPGSLFAEFGEAILELSGPSGYVVHGVTRKGVAAHDAPWHAARRLDVDVASHSESLVAHEDNAAIPQRVGIG